ncbi:MAG: DUF5615 family PIN-like protein [Promethearchaeia archaeon]
MRFLLDAMFGKLTRFLRMFGYDAIYAGELRDYFGEDPVPDKKLLEYARSHERIIITRDFPFYKIAGKSRAVYIDGEDVYINLQKLKKKLNLSYRVDMDSARCSVCNSPLSKIDKEKAKDSINQNSLKYFHEFYQCQNCEKIFWEGSHIERILKNLKKYGLFNN